MKCVALSTLVNNLPVPGNAVISSKARSFLLTCVLRCPIAVLSGRLALLGIKSKARLGPSPFT